MSCRGKYILEEPGRHGRNHIESGLGRYIPLCGADIDSDAVERVPYEVSDEGWEQSHETFCMACTQVQNRRAVEGNGGALSL